MADETNTASQRVNISELYCASQPVTVSLQVKDGLNVFVRKGLCSTNDKQLTSLKQVRFHRNTTINRLYG